MNMPTNCVGSLYVWPTGDTFMHQIYAQYLDRSIADNVLRFWRSSAQILFNIEF